MKRTWTSSESSALTRLFSSGVVRELARHGHSPLFGRLLSEIDLPNPFPNVNTLGDFLDWAYSESCRKVNRHEYIYKNAIAQKVLLGKHSLNTACMLTEFRVGKCKADVVILNGTSTAYEIKSERDDLGRLEQQLSEYLTVFDYVQVITGEAHLDALERSVPRDVGIQILTDRFTIHDHRLAASNVRNTLPDRVFESLQRTEYLAVLEMNGMSVSKLPNTQVHAFAKNLFLSLKPEQAHAGMVAVLKRTRNHTQLREFIDSLPDALKATAVSVRLNQRERSRLLNTLNMEFGAAMRWA